MKHTRFWICICAVLTAAASMQAETKDSVFYVNNTGWADVYCYAWGENDLKNAEWPGVKLTTISYTLNGESSPIYFYTANEHYTQCIFNNGVGEQTDDLSWTSQGYYKSGEWLAQIDLGGTTGIHTTDTCYLINAAGWDLCYSYAWQKSGGTGNEEIGWPGRKLKKMDYQIKGYDVYAYIYEPKWQFCIFNNGTDQSADLICNHNHYFFNNEWQGKWYTREEAEVMTTIAPTGDPHPTQKFYYTTTDGLTVTPTGDIAAFGGATVISNTYTDGQGCIVFDRDLCFLGKSAFKDCTTLETVAIPNSVYTIAYEAFANCTSLSKVSVGTSVISIGMLAFQGCTSLEQVSIPSSVSIIGNNAFADCTNLQEVTCYALEPPYLGTTVFSNVPVSGCNLSVPYFSQDLYLNAPQWQDFLVQSYNPPTANQLIHYTSTDDEIVLPHSADAFGGAYMLSNTYTDGQGMIIFDRDLTTIDSMAYNQCTTLQTISLPASVEKLGAAFAGCSSLTSISVAAGNSHYRNIGDAVYSIDGKTLVVVPAGSAATERVLSAEITRIESMAMSSYTALTSLTAMATEPAALGGNVWAGVDCANVDLFVPYIAINMYSHAAQWKEFNIRAIPGTEPSAEEAQIAAAPCPDAADGHCGEALTWTLDEASGILTIAGSGAMYDYPKDSCVPWHDIRGAIRQVVLPAGLSHVGDNAFFGCEALEDINVPAGASVGLQAFGHCPELNL